MQNVQQGSVYDSIYHNLSLIYWLLVFIFNKYTPYAVHISEVLYMYIKNLYYYVYI